MSTLIKLGVFTQTPSERKRYTFSYVEWLDDGETVVSAEATIDPATTVPLVVDDLVVATDVVSFFVSGGDEGTKNTVSIDATTSVGQVKEDAISVSIKDH